MDNVATRTPSDRADLFRETASRTGLIPALVQKHSWVCWTHETRGARDRGLCLVGARATLGHVCRWTAGGCNLHRIDGDPGDR